MTDHLPDIYRSEQEIEQAALLAIGTRGFPAAVAALGWVREVVPARVCRPPQGRMES